MIRQINVFLRSNEVIKFFGALKSRIFQLLEELRWDISTTAHLTSTSSKSPIRTNKEKTSKIFSDKRKRITWENDCNKYEHNPLHLRRITVRKYFLRVHKETKMLAIIIIGFENSIYNRVCQISYSRERHIIKSHCI